MSGDTWVMRDETQRRALIRHLNDMPLDKPWTVDIREGVRGQLQEPESVTEKLEAE